MGNPYRHPISTPVPELQGIATIASPPMTDDLVGRQRAALIEAGREDGAFIADDVSDDFLLYVPGEVKGRIAKLTARIEALEGALKQAHDLLMCVEQSHDNLWWVAADDPETAVCDTFSAIESVLPAALAKDKSDG